MSEEVKTLKMNAASGEEQYLSIVRRKRVVSIIIKTIIYIFLSLWALIAVFPVIWTLMNSFKTRSSITSDPFAFPHGDIFSVSGYTKLFQGDMNILVSYLNSFLISGLVVIGTVFTAILAAFVLARYSFKGKKIVYTLVVACMMFPAFSLMFPILRLLSAVNLYNTQIGVVLPQIALNVGFTVILLLGFFQGLPIEVEESAYIDGASVIRVLFQIMVPMAKSAIITCVIFVFLWSYNDLFLQMLIITNVKRFPISLLLNQVSTSQALGYEYDKMAAASTLVCIPVILVYAFLQKHIIKGLTAGAVKG